MEHSELVEPAPAAWLDLQAKLLAIGGKGMVSVPEPHLGILLTRGRIFAGRMPIKVRGWDKQCHNNVVVHHLDRRGELEIVTGYALTSDDLWWHHSWLWDGQRVLETTPEKWL